MRRRMRRIITLHRVPPPYRPWFPSPLSLPVIGEIITRRGGPVKGLGTASPPGFST